MSALLLGPESVLVPVTSIEGERLTILCLAVIVPVFHSWFASFSNWSFNHWLTTLCSCPVDHTFSILLPNYILRAPSAVPVTPILSVALVKYEKVSSHGLSNVRIDCNTLQIFRLRHKKYLKPRGNPRKSLLYGGHRKHQLEILYRLKTLQGLQRLSSLQCLSMANMWCPFMSWFEFLNLTTIVISVSKAPFYNITIIVI